MSATDGYHYKLMATLISNTFLLEIKPSKLESKDTPLWIETIFNLHIYTPGQKFSISPTKPIALQVQDFIRLLDYKKSFIEELRLREILLKRNEFTSVNQYKFVPLELYFQFSFLEGDISEALDEGVISIGVMVNLNVADRTLSSNYVGVEASVNVEAFLSFFSLLESELRTLLDESS